MTKKLAISNDRQFLATVGFKRVAIAKIIGDLGDRELEFKIDQENQKIVEYEGDQLEVQFSKDLDIATEELFADSQKKSKAEGMEDEALDIKLFLRAKGDVEFHRFGFNFESGTIEELKNGMIRIDEFWDLTVHPDD